MERFRLNEFFFIKWMEANSTTFLIIFPTFQHQSKYQLNAWNVNLSSKSEAIPSGVKCIWRKRLQKDYLQTTFFFLPNKAWKEGSEQKRKRNKWILIYRKLLLCHSDYRFIFWSSGSCWRDTHFPWSLSLPFIWEFEFKRKTKAPSNDKCRQQKEENFFLFTRTRTCFPSD